MVFGLNCYGVGDAIRVGEGTCAVLRGKQAAFEIAMQMGKRVNYDEYLSLSRDYIDSQQHPVRVLDKPAKPSKDRMNEKGFVIADCLYGLHVTLVLSHVRKRPSPNLLLLRFLS